MLLYFKINAFFKLPLFNLGGYHAGAQEAALKLLHPTQFEMFSMVWASNYLYLKEIEARGIPTEVFTFEEMMSNGARMLQRFSELSGLRNKADIQNGLKAYETDSQNGSPYNRHNRNFKLNTNVTSEMRQRLNGFCKELGVPKIEAAPKNTAGA